MRLSLVLLVLTCSVTSADEPTRFRFRNVTKEAGLEEHFRATFTHALALGDFDNDGRLDFFLGTFSDRNAKPYGRDKAPLHMLFRQSKAGRFERVSSPAVELPARCSGAVFADLDNDGELDLYVSSNRWEEPSPDATRREPRDQGCRLYRRTDGTFLDVSKESGACPDNLLRCREIGVFDFDNDGLLDLLVLQNSVFKRDGKTLGSRLFRNTGKMRFEDATEKAGLPNDLWGYGIAVADVNGDRRPDFFVCGPNRLYLSQPGGAYKEAVSLRPVFDHKGEELNAAVGASFGDLDLDGNLDLVVGSHSYLGPSRVYVFRNEGLKDGIPMFRNITKELGLSALPQKAPHPEIQDFDNDGIPDLYWSTFLAEGQRRSPFICRGLGVKDGLPRFEVPRVPPFEEKVLKTNTPAEGKPSMIYYVNSPAVDYDGDGRVDLCCGNWPPGGTHFYRNETAAGNWLTVRVQGTTMNRMGIGAQVRLYPAGSLAQKERQLLGHGQISVNGGYSTGRPALLHFGLGKHESCDVEITFASRDTPLRVSRVQGNRLVTLVEPR